MLPHTQPYSLRKETRQGGGTGADFRPSGKQQQLCDQQVELSVDPAPNYVNLFSM